MKSEELHQLYRMLQKYKESESLGDKLNRAATLVIDSLEVHPNRKIKMIGSFDRWANGNQYGSFNSDDD